MTADASRLRDHYKLPFHGSPALAPQRAHYHSGMVKLIEVLTNGFDSIKAGDLLYLAGAYARPATALTWTTDLITTQANFANLFMGIAWEDQSPTGAGAAAGAGNRSIVVEVSNTAIYKYLLAVPSVFPIRQFFGPAKSAGNELVNDRLAEVAVSTSAIAFALKENAESGANHAYVNFCGFMTPMTINSDMG